MGKTSQPIDILIPEEWVNHPAIQDLIKKGHKVCWDFNGSPDLVLGPTAHYFTKEMLTEKLLEAALKRARKGKKEKKS